MRFDVGAFLYTTVIPFWNVQMVHLLVPSFFVFLILVFNGAKGKFRRESSEGRGSTVPPFCPRNAASTRESSDRNQDEHSTVIFSSLFKRADATPLNKCSSVVSGIFLASRNSALDFGSIRDDEYRNDRTHLHTSDLLA